MSIINLVPDDYLILRMRRRITRISLILLAIVMSAIMCAYAVSRRTSSSTRQVMKQLDVAYDEAGKLITQMQQLQSRQAQLVQQAKQATALLERVPRSEVLRAISQACPMEASLRTIRLETRRGESSKPQAKPDSKTKTKTKFQTVAEQKAAPGGAGTVEIWITGFAGADVEVAKFIANLARNQMMSQVDLIYSEQKEYRDLQIREFQIRLELRPPTDDPCANKAAVADAAAGGRA